MKAFDLCNENCVVLLVLMKYAKLNKYPDLLIATVFGINGRSRKCTVVDGTQPNNSNWKDIRGN